MIGLLAAAQAATIDAADLREILREVVPQTEQVLGVSLQPLPRLRIQDTDTAARLLSMRLLKNAPPDSPLRDPARALLAARAEIRNIPAYYDPVTDTVNLVPDSFDGIEQRLGPDLEMVETLLPCILAHELTHVVQYRGGVLRTAPNEVVFMLRRMLIEGHANHIGARVCEALGNHTGAELMRAMHQPHPLASAPRSLEDLPEEHAWSVMAYGYAWVAFDNVYAQGGDHAAWELLRQPPPEPAGFFELVFQSVPEDGYAQEQVAGSCEPLLRPSWATGSRWVPYGAGLPLLTSALIALQPEVVSSQGCTVTGTMEYPPGAPPREVHLGQATRLVFASEDHASAFFAAYVATARHPGSAFQVVAPWRRQPPGLQEAAVLEGTVALMTLARRGPVVVAVLREDGRLSTQPAAAITQQMLAMGSE